MLLWLVMSDETVQSQDKRWMLTHGDVHAPLSELSVFLTSL